MLDLVLHFTGNAFGVSGSKAELCAVFEPTHWCVIGWDNLVGVAILELPEMEKAALGE